MKKAFVGAFVLVFVVIATNLCYSQESDSNEKTAQDYSDCLRMNLLPLFRGGFQLSYEKLFEDVSFCVSGELNAINIDDRKVSGGMGELQVRVLVYDKESDAFVFSNRNIFYMAPFVSYRYKQIKDDYYYYPYDETETYTDKIRSYMLGLLFGLNFISDDRVNVDLNLGAAIRNSSISAASEYHDYENTIFSPGYSGVLPIANLSFGIVF